MKLFHCDLCHQVIYFENYECANCGSVLGFCPDLLTHDAFELAGNGLWKSLSAQAGGKRYKRCRNHQQNACNWMIPEDSENQYCISCDFNLAIPDLNNLEHKTYWQELEIAKRRLIYSLINLKLPIKNKRQDPERGLQFSFLSNLALDQHEQKPVLTGHNKGLITLNIAEANDVYREKMRLDMDERYRTLLGHFRHEIGHYYWFLFVQNSPCLEEFRQLFGDERLDYNWALNNYYQNRGNRNWPLVFISQYASAHPWEDWAETWAHYLHMVDTLDSARSWGLVLKPFKNQSQKSDAEKFCVTADAGTFDEMLQNWIWVFCALNSFNRSMGMKDVYPFVLSQNVISKLKFVHHLIHSNDPA